MNGKNIQPTAIRRKSMSSGKESTRVLNLDYNDYIAWKFEGALIQDALPYLSAEDREFLMTGITPEEWNTLFAGNEE